MAGLMMRSVFAKRALMNPALTKINVARALSSVPVNKANPQGWKSWKEIPDSALPPIPDETNGLYWTKEYKDLQKRRIWYQIDDGTPVYFKEGLKDKVIVYTYVVSLFSLLAYEYYIIFTKVSV